MREPLSLLFTTWGFSSQTLTAAQKPRGSSAALSRSAIAPASSPMCPAAPAPAPAPARPASRSERVTGGGAEAGEAQACSVSSCGEAGWGGGRGRSV
ncbi:unnamed protein product [Caretta caretta]